MDIKDLDNSYIKYLKLNSQNKSASIKHILLVISKWIPWIILSILFLLAFTEWFVSIHFTQVQNVWRLFNKYFVLLLIILIVWLIIAYRKSPEFKKYIDFSFYKNICYYLAFLIAIWIIGDISKVDETWYPRIEKVITIFFIAYLIASVLTRVRNGITIEQFKDLTGKNDDSIKGINQLLTYEIDRLKRLYDLVDKQRMPVKYLLSNYPESNPPLFQSKDMTKDFEDIKSDPIKLGNFEIPLSIFSFLSRLTGGCRIIGTVSSIENELIISAELIGKYKVNNHPEQRNTLKKYRCRRNPEIGSKKQVGCIWNVHSNHQHSHSISEGKQKTVQELIKELACLIFTSTFLKDFPFRPQAIMHFNQGLGTYKSALHQPFLRRQLLTDSEHNFRKAIAEDDCFYHALHNLGIVYLDMDMRSKAERLFNMAIEKKSSHNASRYALASSIFDPICNTYAPIMRKFIRAGHKGHPYVSLHTQEIYKKISKDYKDNKDYNENIKKCLKAKLLCDSIIKGETDKKNDIKDDFQIEAYHLRGSIFMYIGEEANFFNDCWNALCYSNTLYKNAKNEDDSKRRKDKLIESLHNFAMACTRQSEINAFKMVEKLNVEPKDPIVKFLHSITNYYKAAEIATDWAECLDPNCADTFYIRGRVNFEFHYFNKAKGAFKQASNLLPENLNYIANYAASIIQHVSPLESYNKDYDFNYKENFEENSSIIYDEEFKSLKWAMDKLLSCPSRIRHETIERINNIHPFEITKNSSIDDHALQEFNNMIAGCINVAKLLTFIVHHFDRSMIVKSIYRNPKIGECIDKILDDISKHDDSKCQIDIELWDLWNKVEKCYQDELNISLDSLFEKCILNKQQWKDWIKGQIYALIGRDFLMHSKYENAYLCFNGAKKIFKNDFQEEISSQKLHTYCGYSLSSDKTKRSEALNEIFEALSDDPLDSMAHFGNGKINVLTGNYIYAHESFMTALALSPEPKWVPIQLWYEDRITIQPIHLYIYFGITSVNYAESKAPKNNRLQVLVDGIQALLYVFEMINAVPVGNKESLSQFWNQDSNEIKAKTRYWLGKAYFLHGEYQNAIEQLKTSLLRKNNCILSLYFIARSYQRMRNLSEAIIHFDKVISKGNSNPDLFGDWTEDNSFKLEGIIVLAYLYRACCFAGVSMLEKADDDIQEAIIIINGLNIYVDQPKLKPALQIANGIVAYHKNNISESVRLLRDALSHSTDPELLDHLQLAIIRQFLSADSELKANEYLFQANAILALAENDILSDDSKDLLKRRVDCLNRGK